ncbi:MAG: cupin domain-containing protein, partial [Solirubrobacteraceae bacterium]
VPAWVPHREENPSEDEAAVVVLARSTPEEIVVNLPSLWSVNGIPGASEAPHTH